MLQSGDRVLIRGLGEAVVIRLELDRSRAVVRRELSTGQMSPFPEHVFLKDLRRIDVAGSL